MDGRGFDDMTRRLATGRSRRAMLKGLLGVGSAAAAVAVSRERGEAAWSTLVCLPGECGSYSQRLVPTAAVPFYVYRYGAVLPENGTCPVCEPESVEVTCADVLCGTVLNNCCQEVSCGLCPP